MASNDDNDLDFSKGSSAFELTRRDPDRKMVRWLMFGVGGLAIGVAAIVICRKDIWKDEGIGERVIVGDIFVYYTPPVSEEEARGFGRYLQQFRPLNKIEILLERDGPRWVVTLPSLEQERKDPQVIQGLCGFKEMASRDYFGGAPVVLQICDYPNGFRTVHVHRVIE